MSSFLQCNRGLNRYSDVRDYMDNYEKTLQLYSKGEGISQISTFSFSFKKKKVKQIFWDDFSWEGPSTLPQNSFKLSLDL